MHVDRGPDTAPAADGSLDTQAVQHAERRLLASVLEDPALYDEVADRINAESFSVGFHKLIWESVRSRHAQGLSTELISVANELERRHRGPNRPKFMERLEELMRSAAPGRYSFEAAVEVVADAALRRRLCAFGEWVATQARRAARADLLLDEVEQQVAKLGPSHHKRPLSVAEAIAALQRSLERLRPGDLPGHRTGFPRIDEMIGGLQPCNVVTVAARPGTGKTAFALQVARHIAEATAQAVLVLSYEMTFLELARRLIMQETGRDPLCPEPGYENAAAHLKALEPQLATLKGLPLMIADRPPKTVGEIRWMLRQTARTTPLAAVVVDYLQLVDGDRDYPGGARAFEVAEVSRGLKRLAVELEVPILALSQMNRRVEERPDRRPMLSDLRESGSIEQDSSAVLFLSPQPNSDAGAGPERYECIVAKNRSGSVGTVRLLWDKARVRFREDPSGPCPEAPGPRWASPLF